MTTQSPALFLDRDGVINVDRGYVCRIEDIQFIPGIFQLARFAITQLRWPVVVVTNQSGIGRGYFDEISYQKLTEWLCAQFEKEGAPLSRVYHCPFHPEYGLGAYKADHDWRKPKPGMIFQAASDLAIDLPNSVLLGDKPEDIMAAAAAGIRLRILMSASRETFASLLPSHLQVQNLHQALSLLKSELLG